MSSALRRHFGDADLFGMSAGTHLICRIPANLPEAPACEARGLTGFRSIRWSSRPLSERERCLIGIAIRCIAEDGRDSEGSRGAFIWPGLKQILTLPLGCACDQIRVETTLGCANTVGEFGVPSSCMAWTSKVSTLGGRTTPCWADLVNIWRQFAAERSNQFGSSNVPPKQAPYLRRFWCKVRGTRLSRHEYALLPLTLEHFVPDYGRSCTMHTEMS
jgi:hypothetical protein